LRSPAIAGPAVVVGHAVTPGRMTYIRQGGKKTSGKSLQALEINELKSN
jgi:hypothetical protein